ncbi:MAG: acetate/propionate family kinase [Deltaproteobacteria bacterium]|nr:acetate/propionate family kinase [Deltaproteobacteria bacterium]
MDVFSVLRSCEVFADFETAALERLASASVFADYSSGELILARGQTVDVVGVVVSGAVEVRFSPDKPPASLKPGQIFGEVSLLTGEPAMADVVAAAPSRIVRIPQEALTREMGLAPKAARRLARLLTERLARRGDDPDEQAMVEQARAQARARGASSGAGETVLVVNMGSSSIKYALFAGDERRASGLVERIGLGTPRHKHEGKTGRIERDLDIKDHEAGLKAVLDALVHKEHGAVTRLADITAVGHRTVHGGDRFTEATVIDDAVKAELRSCAVLAPLHNPLNLLGIELCERLLPGLPQVAVFDTAFHMTMPEHAYRYAIPRDVAEKHRLRRYGFHGTSHKYVSRAAGDFLGRPGAELKMITCHLGNGASITAVNHGRSVDTSMGLTPLEGLVMGTRSGDVDPGLVLHLLGQGMTQKDVDAMLNKKSGLLGLSGLSSDMRELEQAADAGHPGALLAIASFCYRARKYIGAYTAAMGGLDALVFTGGIGENGAGVRSRICQGLGCFGIALDEGLNRARGAATRLVSAEGSRVKVLVVPTDEEGAIAAETARALKRAGVTEILKARRDRAIPIGVSAHHLHLSQEHVEALFGAGRTLTFRSELAQPGQFACAETVDLVGPKGRVDKVRVLGPVRPVTQVEISRTEEFKLGIDAPIRASGDVKGSPGLVLVGPAGRVELREGTICALRHIHMSPEDALTFGLRDKDVVRVKIAGERSLIYGDVLVRVHPDFTLEMHIDTDEANAAEVHPDMVATLESIQHRQG